ncbi:MAG: hypothetical protein JJT95_10510 [Pararhodobacter sp.]|nr:hypothetical protein [Pararhodobacter sp.]
MSKTFTYSQDGLSYTVTVYEDPDNPGSFKADITVDEGSMDVNAFYWSSEDYDGDNAAPTKGPLNMNGEGSQYEGEQVTWAGGAELSRPGLGREGEDKETFLTEGETLTVDLDGLDSLDDIDFFGIRATSVNGGGSIKGVSGDPENGDDNGDDNGEDPATYDKVFFVSNPEGGGGKFYELGDLDEDAEGTFADYVALWQADAEAGETFGLDELQEVRFWPEGATTFDPELTIVAPEGGFESYEALVQAYEDAIEAMQEQGIDTSSLQIAMLAEGEGWTDDPVEDEETEDAA